MSPVTVSVVGRGGGNGIIRYGFWNLDGNGKRCHMLRFLRSGGERIMLWFRGGWTRCHMLRFRGLEKGRDEKVLHVTVSGVWKEGGTVVTCYDV